MVLAHCSKPQTLLEFTATQQKERIESKTTKKVPNIAL